MKNTIIILLLCFAFAWTNSDVFAQDIHFTQFSNCPLSLNPATTVAFKGDHRVITNYRNQWHSITVPYRTYSLSYDARLLRRKINNGKLGVGVFLYNDKAGDLDLSIFQGNLSVAYHLEINKNNTLGAGISGGFAQRSINQNNMQWESQYHSTVGYTPSTSSGEIVNYNKLSHGDIGAGIVWQYFSNQTNMTSNDGINSQVGVGIFHVNNDVSFYDNNDLLLSKIVLHGRLFFEVKNTNLALIPQGALYIQGPQKEMILGSLFRYKLSDQSKYTSFKEESALSIGGLYRVGDAIAPILQFEIANWAAGISYDLNISKLKAVSNIRGGFEVYLIYVTPSPFRRSGSALL